MFFFNLYPGAGRVPGFQRRVHDLAGAFFKSPQRKARVTADMQRRIVRAMAVVEWIQASSSFSSCPVLLSLGPGAGTGVPQPLPPEQSIADRRGSRPKRKCLLAPISSFPVLIDLRRQAIPVQLV
ncbi:hypothetical protein PVAP13_3KG206016 [Panicum virgatum]|uniref:Uncharacterized protein n=1 Tax=Panicum virgatum TaxID=38727 RepID=A0A8T0UWH4_PANVG|nr:hypothetical protein PVAP13_3KG206016 [Panicum virgatum]